MDPSQTDPSGGLAYYISIASGLCLAISEALPYLSKVKGNGIIQVALQYFNQHEEEKRKDEQQQHEVFQAILARLDTLIALQQQQTQQTPSS